MPEFEEFIDLLSATFVIIIISLLITLAWMSTYVRDQPIVATAVVVIQRETVQNSSMENTSYTPGSSGSRTECVTPSNVSSELEAVEGSAHTEDEQKEDISLQDSEAKDQIEISEEKTESENQANSEQSCSSTIVKLDRSGECITVNHLSEEEISKDDSDSSLRKRMNVKPNESESLTDDISESVNPENNTQDGNISQESIRIKLKFLDDTQRLVRGQLTDEVGNFKRANFDPELSSNRVVRLIFNGQLLNRDTSTLGQYGLFDNCVVHCHISQPQVPSASERNGTGNAENEGLDLSEFLSPLLLVIVAFLWYLRYEYAYIFNTSATIVLVCLTALLLISQYALVVSFNISLGFERGNGNNSSSSGSGSSNNSSRSGISTDSQFEIELPQIEQNPEASTSHPSNTEGSEEEDSSTNCQIESRIYPSLDSRTETLGTSISPTNHRPQISSTMQPVLGR